MKLTLILFLITFSAISQNIAGKVLDHQTNLPIEGVSIHVKNIKKGTVSDQNGFFQLKFNIKANDSILFSHVNYIPKTITLSNLRKKGFDILLIKKTENLNPVIINPQKKLNKHVPVKRLASMKKPVYAFGSSLIKDSIYVIAGNGSYLEDTEKKAFLEVAKFPNSSFKDLLKRLSINPTWVGYRNQLQVYSINENKWYISDIRFRERAYHNINLSQKNIYVLGGKRLSNNNKKEYLDHTIEILNLEKDSVILDETNPHQAINFASFNYKNNLIMMGGSIKQDKKGQKTFTDKAHMLNTETGYWYQLNNMLECKEAKGILIDNFIYLIGGNNGKPLKTVERYNILTGVWEIIGEIFEPCSRPGLAYHNNSIYIFTKGKILTFNIVSGVLNEYNIRLNIQEPHMYFCDDKLLILGGFIENEYSKTGSNNLYQVAINEFKNTEITQSKQLKEFNLISN
ncbi:carboxypeptidase-like regulatory domain-containing protein [Flavobacteriaceae bacterium GSB9]|nr:carboxypeptidase-like regulatory domain-containing protein [Flavobacteriaceae bacterium GSB9]